MKLFTLSTYALIVAMTAAVAVPVQEGHLEARVNGHNWGTSAGGHDTYASCISLSYQTLTHSVLDAK